MLDKTSKEYKKVKKLYSQGKISKEDYKRLLAALESFEQEETAVSKSSAEEADNTVGRLIKELGIKISSSIKNGWNMANNAVEKVGETIRGAVRRAAYGVAESLDDDQEKNPCCTPEQYLIPYEKMYIRLNYIGEKPVEVITKTKKQTKLAKKFSKIMSVEMSEKLNGLLSQSFVGKYECSIDDEYMRLIVRPKKEL